MSRPPKVSPQPWKLEIPEQLDLNEEFEIHDDPTQQVFITDPEDYMEDVEFEEATTDVYEIPIPLVKGV